VSTIPLKADYALLIPPAHLIEAMGITAIDFTKVDNNNRPLESKPSFSKVKEMIFSALLQGYEVTAENRGDGFTTIKIIPRSEIEKLNQRWQVIKRED
jgi:hypothetical protein